MRPPEQPARPPDSKHSVNPNLTRTSTGYLASLRAPWQQLHLMNRSSSFWLPETTGNRRLGALDIRINWDSGVISHRLSAELVHEINLTPPHRFPVSGGALK